MAGSYRHCVGGSGRLLPAERLLRQLDTGGDVLEAITEMHGMIQWLARTLAARDSETVSPNKYVQMAERYWKG